MGGKPFPDLAEAKELLKTITKRTHSNVMDDSVISAIQLLLRDYIERALNAKRDADKLASQ